MKKSLQTTDSMGYSSIVAGIPAAGFDSPILRRTHRLISQIGGFFASVAQHCSCMGGGVRGASCPPSPGERSVNPHIAALFAFDGAEGGLSLSSGVIS
jgi:hypothetical protein